MWAWTNQYQATISWHSPLNQSSAYRGTELRFISLPATSSVCRCVLGRWPPQTFFPLAGMYSLWGRWYLWQLHILRETVWSKSHSLPDRSLYFTTFKSNSSKTLCPTWMSCFFRKYTTTQELDTLEMLLRWGIQDDGVRARTVQATELTHTYSESVI